MLGFVARWFERKGEGRAGVGMDVEARRDARASNGEVAWRCRMRAVRVNKNASIEDDG